METWLKELLERTILGFTWCPNDLVHQVTRTGLSDSSAAGCFTLSAN